MSTKTRITVTLSSDLVEKLRAKADHECRSSLSDQIEWEMKHGGGNVHLFGKEVKQPIHVRDDDDPPMTMAEALADDID